MFSSVYSTTTQEQKVVFGSFIRDHKMCTNHQQSGKNTKDFHSGWK